MIEGIYSILHNFHNIYTEIFKILILVYGIITQYLVIIILTYKCVFYFYIFYTHVYFTGHIWSMWIRFQLCMWKYDILHKHVRISLQTVTSL